MQISTEWRTNVTLAAISQSIRETRWEWKALKVILRQAKKRSKNKGLEFDLTLSDLISLKNNTCPILGCEILYRSGIDYKRSASLDRIDPNKGYINGNVKIISYEANSLKNRNNFHSAVKMLEYIITNSPPEDIDRGKRDKLLNLLKDFY